MTSNDLFKANTKTQATVKDASNKKNKIDLKGGSMQKNIEINDEHLNEILQKNDL